MKKTRTTLLLLTLTLFFVFQAALAVADYREIELHKTEAKSEAHGYITIKPIGFVPTDRLLHVNVYSLRPETLYDVWIVDRNTKKRTPAGFQRENTFHTNAGGAGHFIYRTTEFILGWNKLEVSAHREGDSSDNSNNFNDVKVILWTWMYQ